MATKTNKSAQKNKSEHDLKQDVTIDLAQKTISYTEAYDELQSLVSELENDDVAVDNLIDKLKRAGFLLKICKTKLKDTEKEAEELLQQIDLEE